MARQLPPTINPTIDDTWHQIKIVTPDDSPLFLFQSTLQKLCQSNHPAEAVLLYVFFTDLAMKQVGREKAGLLWANQKYISQKTGLSYVKIRHGLTVLKKLRLLKEKKQKRGKGEQWDKKFFIFYPFARFGRPPFRPTETVPTIKTLKDNNPDATTDRWRMKDFEMFWKNYPPKRRNNKPDAKKAWKQKIREKVLPPQSFLMERLHLYSEIEKNNDDYQYVPAPARYLRNDSWENPIGDETEPVTSPKKIKKADRIMERKAFKLAGSFAFNYHCNIERNITEEEEEALMEFGEAMVQADFTKMASALPLVKDFAKFVANRSPQRLNIEAICPPDGSTWKKFMEAR